MGLCAVLRSQNEIEENSTVKILKNNVFSLPSESEIANNEWGGGHMDIRCRC